MRHRCVENEKRERGELEEASKKREKMQEGEGCLETRNTKKESRKEAIDDSWKSCVGTET